MNQRTWMRVVMSVGLGLAVGFSVGCLQEEDDFVEQYAVALCDSVRECGASLTLPGGEILPSTSECESVVEAHYRSCGDRCEYQPKKARRCLRRLNNNSGCGELTLNNPGGDELIPLVCDAVYTRCGGDDQSCQAPTCAVIGSGHRAGFGWALALLALGVVGRRRSAFWDTRKASRP